MGFGGISPLSLLLILLIVVLLFGTKKLRNMGGDLGSAIRNFKASMQSGEKDEKPEDDKQLGDSHTIDAEVESKHKNKV